MDSVQTINHSKWECKYHVVWIPNVAVGFFLDNFVSTWEVFLHKLVRQKESRILGGHLLSNHVHMLISIPPKYLVSHDIGYLKGKSAIHIAMYLASDGTTTE